MGESKENDIDVGSVTESVATGTKLEAGETLAAPMACEDASLCQGEVVVEEGGSLDIMVEVLGSDVFVDGVCTSSGDGIGENAGDGDAAGGEGAELDSLAVAKAGTQEVETSVKEVANCGTEHDGRDLSGQRCSVSEEPVTKERGEGVERGAEDSSSGVEDGVDGETQAVTEEVTQVMREEVSTEELVQEGLQEDESKEDQEDVQRDKSKEECVLGDEVQDPAVENGLAGVGGETQVVVDKVSSTVVESMSCTTVWVKQDSKLELDEGSGAHNDSDKQKADILDNAEARNPGVATAVVCSSTVVESISVSTQDSQGTSDIVKDKSLNPEVDVASAGPESLDIPAQPTVGEEVGGKDNEKLPCSGAEGMETDACDESSRDEEQAYVEVGCRGIEDHSNVLADPVLSCQSTKDQQSTLDESLSEQVELEETGSKDNEIEPIVSDRIEKGVASKIIEDLTNSKFDDQVFEEKDQHLRSEACVDRSVASDIVQLKSHARQETEVQGKATDAKVKEQPIDGGAESKVEGLSDSASLCQPSQVYIKGDVSAMDVNVLPNQHLEIQDSIAVDRMLPCSEDDQNLKAETVQQSKEIDNQASTGVEIATESIEAMNVDDESQGPDVKDHQLKFECSDNSAVHDLSGVDSIILQDMVNENQVTDAARAIAEGGQEMESEEQVDDNEEPKSMEQSINLVTEKPGSSARQASYQLPTENDGEFFVSDLVWGKVRSHPWWPGQIFDPSDASQKAMKYHKKDCFLVAYFGDRTFAWNGASLLKPFQRHFSQIEKQGTSEAFQNAVECALKEVSRRVELGLACFCIPNDAHDRIKFQVVANAGIQQESSIRDGVDKSASASSFEPSKLVEYMKALAQSPTAGADQLELVITMAQLHSFYRFKGYPELPEFQFCGATETLCSEDQVHLDGLAGHSDVSEDVDEKISESKKSVSHKRKHNLRDMYPIKKERSTPELMGEALDCLDSDGPEGKAASKLPSPTAAKMCTTFGPPVDDSVIQDGIKSSLAKVPTSATPKESFKIGECIQRAATQLTGPPSILKNNSDKLSGDSFGVSAEELEDGQMILPTECTSLDELLSQLHLAAQNPFQGYSFLNMIFSFFCDFRDSVVPSQNLVMEMGSGKRKMPSHFIAGFPETFEFVDMNDSYWTDMVVQNGSLEQLSQKSKKGEYQIVPVALEPDKSIQPGRRPYSRKRSREADNELSAETQAYMYERRRASPAEIIMTFSTVNSVPSETNLNKMFRRFGPLKELETEVDRETCRARVVFKKGSDAEVACSSAEKFNIFGPLVVNYQLNFYPFEPFKALYFPSTEGLEEATLFLHAQG